MEKAIKESKGETVKDVVRDIRFSRQLNELGLESFDKETLNNIKMRYGVVVDSYKSLEQNIEKAINTDEKVNLYLGTVDNAILSKIEQSVHELLFTHGKNYTFVVSYDDIRHIKHHFDVNNMATEILKIYEIFKTYDNVKYINDKNNKKLVFEKSFDNADYRTVELVSNKKSSIDLVTLFIKKINNKKTVNLLMLLMNKALAHVLKRTLHRLSILIVYSQKMKMSRVQTKIILIKMKM